MSQVRSPAVAGQFYPAEEQALRAEVEGFLRAAGAAQGPRPRVLIVPHAGYYYSGAVAAEAYQELEGWDYEQVYLLGPSHHFGFSFMAGTDYASWQTPLGRSPLRCLEGVPINNPYHAPEHSLEVQLPFLQVLLSQAELTPLLLSGGMGEAKAIAERLKAMDPSALLVVSSDFNHCGPRFGYEPPGMTGKELDLKIADAICAGSPGRFRALVTQYKATVCGALPILVSLYLLQYWGGAGLTLKAYGSSSEKSAGPDSVGYAAFYA